VGAVAAVATVATLTAMAKARGRRGSLLTVELLSGGRRACYGCRMKLRHPSRRSS
jgi:hypothetical protein